MRVNGGGEAGVGPMMGHDGCNGAAQPTFDNLSFGCFFSTTGDGSLSVGLVKVARQWCQVPQGGTSKPERAE
jgi:hypothetical protein